MYMDDIKLFEEKKEKNNLKLKYMQLELRVRT